MRVLTFSQARAGLKQAMDDVCRDHEPAVIPRQRGEPVVMLFLDDYNAMNETMYLLGSAPNPTRLRESIAQHKSWEVVAKEILLGASEQESEETEARQASIHFTTIGWEDTPSGSEQMPRFWRASTRLSLRFSGHLSKESANLNP